MNIEFDAYKQKLNEIHPALMGLADSLNLEGLKNELERLQAMRRLPASGTTLIRARRWWLRLRPPRVRSKNMRKCAVPGKI